MSRKVALNTSLCCIFNKEQDVFREMARRREKNLESVVLATCGKAEKGEVINPLRQIPLGPPWASQSLECSPGPPFVPRSGKDGILYVF